MDLANNVYIAKTGNVVSMYTYGWALGSDLVGKTITAEFRPTREIYVTYTWVDMDYGNKKFPYMTISNTIGDDTINDLLNGRVMFHTTWLTF